MLKSELRKIYLQKQKSLSPVEREEKSEQIKSAFFQTFDLRQIKFLHCFLPIKKFNEIDTTRFFEKLWNDFPDITTLVPRVDFENGKIENLKHTAETVLIQNVWDIHEPGHDELIETEKIDLVLVPLLCFDKASFRVGYGKGFYDKFLKNCRADCVKIGLSYFPPIDEISDRNQYDIKLDFCVTPQKVFQSKR